MNGQNGKYYETEQLIWMVEAALNSHRPAQNGKLLDWNNLFRQAEYHRVTGILYYALLAGNYKIPQVCREKFEERYRQCVTGKEILSNVVGAIFWKCETEGWHILQTGSLQAAMYFGQREMGETREAEFVVGRGKNHAVKILMIQMDFELKKQTEKCSVYERDGIRIIFRECFSDENKRVRRYFERPLSSYPTQEGFRYIHCLGLQDTYIRFVCDLAEEFSDSLPRIRTLVNFWMYYTARWEELDFGTLEKLFRKLRLSAFSHHILSLAALWFGRVQVQKDPEAVEELGAFLISGGKEERAILEQELPFRKKRKPEKRGKRKKKEGANWIFPTLFYMKMLFPVLERLPFLLPFCWGARILRLSASYIGKICTGKKKNTGKRQEKGEKP